MLDVYLAATPNGLKIRLFLEETGLPHRRQLVHKVLKHLQSGNSSERS